MIRVGPLACSAWVYQYLDGMAECGLRFFCSHFSAAYSRHSFPFTLVIPLKSRFWNAGVYAIRFLTDNLIRTRYSFLMMKKRPSILFVDNDALYCSVLSSYLAKYSIVTTGIVKHDLTEVSNALSIQLPSIVVVSYKSTQPQTMNTVWWIRCHYPCLLVVIFTQYSSLHTVRICKSVGVTSLVIKSDYPPQKILGVLCAAQEGRRHFPK